MKDVLNIEKRPDHLGFLYFKKLKEILNQFLDVLENADFVLRT